jgi:ectoine hydroxylase-related dioxygenase (phytanoyl-CoA dioxygenase family)
VPPDSGGILFNDDPFEVRLTPEPGLMLLFPPALVHSVEQNRSAERRLSLAFNIGPRGN